jgi:hypothetical protein
MTHPFNMLSNSLFEITPKVPPKTQNINSLSVIKSDFQNKLEQVTCVIGA